MTIELKINYAGRNTSYMPIVHNDQGEAIYWGTWYFSKAQAIKAGKAWIKAQK